MAPNIFLSVAEIDRRSVSQTDKLPETLDPPELSLEFLVWLILSRGRASKHFWYLNLQAASIVWRMKKQVEW